MIENVKNPVIFGIVSMIIGIIAFIINLKLRNEEVDRSEKDWNSNVGRAVIN